MSNGGGVPKARPLMALLAWKPPAGCLRAVHFREPGGLLRMKAVCATAVSVRAASVEVRDAGEYGAHGLPASGLLGTSQLPGEDALSPLQLCGGEPDGVWGPIHGRRCCTGDAGAIGGRQPGSRCAYGSTSMGHVHGDRMTLEGEAEDALSWAAGEPEW